MFHEILTVPGLRVGGYSFLYLHGAPCFVTAVVDRNPVMDLSPCNRGYKYCRSIVPKGV